MATAKKKTATKKVTPKVDKVAIKDAKASLSEIVKIARKSNKVTVTEIVTALVETKKKIAEIKSICQHHRGKSAVYVAVRTDKGLIRTAADTDLSVNPDLDFCRKMRQLVGEENFQLAR